MNTNTHTAEFRTTLARAIASAVNEKAKHGQTQRMVTFASLINLYDTAVENQQTAILQAIRTVGRPRPEDDQAKASYDRQRDLLLVELGVAVYAPHPTKEDQTVVRPNTDNGFVMDTVYDAKARQYGLSKTKSSGYASAKAEILRLLTIFAWMESVQSELGASDVMVMPQVIWKYNKAGDKLLPGQTAIKVRDWFTHEGDVRKANPLAGDGADPANAGQWIFLARQSDRGHVSFPVLEKQARLSMGWKAKETETATAPAFPKAMLHAEQALTREEAITSPQGMAQLRAVFGLTCIKLGIADSDGANFDGKLAANLFAQWMAEAETPAESSTGTDG